MKVYSLEWEDDDPVFDFNLLGLNTILTKDYDFSFYLNKSCGFNLSRIEDQKIIKNGITYIFSVYRFFHQKMRQNIELISNYSYPHKSKASNLQLFDEENTIKILVPEYKTFNYFLKSDFLLDEEFYITLSKLNFIHNYQKIEQENIKIKYLENLILPI